MLQGCLVVWGTPLPSTYARMFCPHGSVGYGGQWAAGGTEKWELEWRAGGEPSQSAPRSQRAEAGVARGQQSVLSWHAGTVFGQAWLTWCWLGKWEGPGAELMVTSWKIHTFIIFSSPTGSIGLSSKVNSRLEFSSLKEQGYPSGVE